MRRHDLWQSPSPLEKAMLGELIAAAKLCYQRGWVYGSAGNFSLRLRGDLVWQSPSGVCKGELSVEGFLPVDPTTGELLAPPERFAGFPSEEMPVHLGIYERVPEARCVVHAHPPAFVARCRHLARHGATSLTFAGHEMQKALGSASFADELLIRVAANQGRETIEAFRTGMDASLNHKARLVVLDAHGVYAWGASPKAALQRIEALEFLCQSAL